MSGTFRRLVDDNDGGGGDDDEYDVSLGDDFPPPDADTIAVLGSTLRQSSVRRCASSFTILFGALADIAFAGGATFTFATFLTAVPQRNRSLQMYIELIARMVVVWITVCARLVYFYQRSGWRSVLWHLRWQANINIVNIVYTGVASGLVYYTALYGRVLANGRGSLADWYLRGILQPQTVVMLAALALSVLVNQYFSRGHYRRIKTHIQLRAVSAAPLVQSSGAATLRQGAMATLDMDTFDSGGSTVRRTHTNRSTRARASVRSRPTAMRTMAQSDDARTSGGAPVRAPLDSSFGI